jgi:hypothetical protein
MNRAIINKILQQNLPVSIIVFDFFFYYGKLFCLLWWNKNNEIRHSQGFCLGRPFGILSKKKWNVRKNHVQICPMS